MAAPLYQYHLFDYNFILIIVLIIGFVFGFLLERAGFGNPRKLTALFYFEDFALLKVMLTAIVICATGLWLLTNAQAIDMTKIAIIHTYLWPQIIAGIILGIGFVIGGYGPSTSVVGIGSGRIDAIIFFIGLILGAGLFTEGYPHMKNFYVSGNMAGMTLPKWFGTSTGMVILMITLFAFISFWIAEKIEK